MALPRIWFGNISPIITEKIGPQEEVKPSRKQHRAATARKPSTGLWLMSGPLGPLGATVKTVATTASEMKISVPPYISMRLRPTRSTSRMPAVTPMILKTVRISVCWKAADSGTPTASNRVLE